MEKQQDDRSTSALRTLYPGLSDEELVEAQDRLRRYLCLAIEVLDELESSRPGETVDDERLTDR